MESDDVILLRGRLNGQQRTRLGKLLDMMYKPSELAEEIGFTVRQVYRVYVPVGCPHEKDHRGRLWINGRMFREWFNEVYKKRKLDRNETFCLTCKKAVKIVDPVKRKEGRLFYWLSDCPNCGRRLARIINRENRG